MCLANNQWKQLSVVEVHSHLCPITVYNGTALAPWRGGLYEKLVGLLKKVFIK